VSATPGLLDRYRSFQAERSVREASATGDDDWAERRPAGSRAIGRSRERAGRLAELLDGAVDEHPDGYVVRVDQPPMPLPLDRAALATLPFPVDPERPLVCLDTETTGLATGAGTVVFLVGLGRWDGQQFRVTQLFLPDHADELAFLSLLATELPPDSWLVTYNGRSFDWPLLQARYRMHRRVPPALAGHLDLLPIARQLFRHRLPDARLGSVESGVCGIERVEDLPGAFVPERYLAFLRHGEPGYLREVALHNEQDVRSLARVLGHLADVMADPNGRTLAHPGDLGRLARAYARQHRDDEALACFDAARATIAGIVGTGLVDLETLRDRAWLTGERARILRRVGRIDDALAAWGEVARGGGRTGARAWIEIAKLHEHRRRDPSAALGAVDRADALIARARLSGRIPAGLDADLSRRRARLRGRLSRLSRAARPGAMPRLGLGSL
jgi:uncharacterized protein YprB with RNaseH-like and TPR domain